MADRCNATVFWMQLYVAFATTEYGRYFVDGHHFYTPVFRLWKLCGSRDGPWDATVLLLDCWNFIVASLTGENGPRTEESTAHHLVQLTGGGPREVGN